MKISVDTIENVLDALLSESRSREEIADWANRSAAEEDAGTLEYEPPSDEPRIWQAVTYLRGVDLKDSPHSYLHTNEDFAAFLDKWRQQ